jgi:hypothetical protein
MSNVKIPMSKERVQGGRSHVAQASSLQRTTCESRMKNHSNRLEAYATSRRATSNHETRSFPEFFPNYFKTDQNSRVSFKDPKVGKMCSFKFPTFESHWTYVNKRPKIDRTCETSGGGNFKCQNPNVKGKRKAEGR